MYRRTNTQFDFLLKILFPRTKFRAFSIDITGIFDQLLPSPRHQDRNMYQPSLKHYVHKEKQNRWTSLCARRDWQNNGLSPISNTGCGPSSAEISTVTWRRFFRFTTISQQNCHVVNLPSPIPTPRQYSKTPSLWVFCYTRTWTNATNKHNTVVITAKVNTQLHHKNLYHVKDDKGE